MIRTGWVRVNTDHPEVSVQVMTLGPGGAVVTVPAARQCDLVAIR
jgi:hypothetical protein